MRLTSFLLYGFALSLGVSFAFKNNAYESPQYRKPTPIVAAAKDQSEKPFALVSKGKSLFKNNCASCHNKNMKDDMTAPALAGVRARWEGREEALYRWIRNSVSLIKEKDPYAWALYIKWDKTVMTSFPNLTDEDIEALLVYIDSK